MSVRFNSRRDDLSGEGNCPGGGMSRGNVLLTDSSGPDLGLLRVLQLLALKKVRALFSSSSFSIFSQINSYANFKPINNETVAISNIFKVIIKHLIK